MFSRPFLVLYASVFVATMGISMVSPLLPVYAEQLGATGIWIGLTFSVFAITQTIFGPFAGRWSDRYGRKPFIVAGLLIYFVAALGYLTASSFYQVLAFRALSGMGTSLIFSVARAYIGDMVPPGHEGRWFGMFATADIIGFGVGPLLAGTIRGFLGFDAVFVAMAALMFSSAGIVSVLLPASGRSYQGGEDSRISLSFREALKDRLVFALTLNMALISVTFGATFSFLAVMLEDDVGVGPVLIGLAFGAESLAAGLTQPFVGRLADLYSRRLLVAVGLAASACVLLGIGFTTTFWVIVLLLVVMGMTSAISQVANSAMQVVAGRHAGMGTVIGLGSAGNGVGIVFGSVAGGVLVDWYGISAAFFFGGISMLAGIPIFLWLTRGVVTKEPVGTPLPGVEGAGS